MPDIDVDFCFERRDELIAYVKQKYGEDRVAQIVAFGTLKGKQAIKDVGRVLGFNFAETDRMAKLYPAPKQGKDYPLDRALEMEPRLREVRDSGAREKELFENALKLEGLFRQTTKHASGIVISNRPLVEDVPLFVDPDGLLLTQYAYNEIDAIGLIKFDFLGLKTLTLIENAVRRAREGGAELDVAALPLDDRKTYELLGRGDTVGVFQMESGGMRKLLTDLRPNCFEDLIAVLALYRPGPLDSGMVEEFIKRKRGREPIHYLDAALEPILKETYGVIVYQEQVMQIAQVLAGYTLGDADNLRRAMGKKKAEEMALERVRFLAGAAKQGLKAEAAGEIFDQMETFAAYGFNKSHSAAYALVSFQTAYLKAHFPQQFMAALLTMEMGDTDKTYKNIADCRARGTRILPPDVNQSGEDFTVDGGDIRFGLGAVRGVGGKAIETILAARTTPFTSLAGLLPPGARPGHQQAPHRKPRRVWCVRLARHGACATSGGGRRHAALGRARGAGRELRPAELVWRRQCRRADGPAADPGRCRMVGKGNAARREGSDRDIPHRSSARQVRARPAAPDQRVDR